jgi:predicted nucleic acid-binding protein
LGLTVVGTLGVLLRARQAGLILSVRPLVDALVVQGFHIDPSLYQEVLALAGE